MNKLFQLPKKGITYSLKKKKNFKQVCIICKLLLCGMLLKLCYQGVAIITTVCEIFIGMLDWSLVIAFVKNYYFLCFLREFEHDDLHIKII